MFGKAKKLKTVEININNEFVMWEVDLSNIDVNANLYVSAGCLALYIVNGTLRSMNTPGRWIINEKKDANAPKRLIGVNSDKTFDIFCGTGDIPYKDYETNIETTVGIRGEAKVRILQPWMVFTTLGKSTLTSDELDEYIRTKLAEIMANNLSAVIQKYDYQSVNTQLNAMSETILDIFAEQCNKIGLQCSSFSVNTVFFNDEFKQARKDYFDSQNKRKEAKLDRREEEKRIRFESEMNKEAAEAAAIINRSLPKPEPKPQPAPQQPSQPQGGYQPHQDFKWCQRCGAKVSVNTRFCPNCGLEFKL